MMDRWIEDLCRSLAICFGGL